MVMITFRFIEDARYHMGSLGFRPKNLEDMKIEKLKEICIDKIFRLKTTLDAFNVNLHYSWLVKHWDNLLKAVVHEKWQLSEYPYTPVDVSLSKKKYENVAIVTNMFDKDVQCFYLDENGKVASYPYNKSSGKDKSKNFQIIDDKPNNASYIFTSDYLNSLSKHESADTDEAVALIESCCLDNNKNKFLFYITYYTENLSKEKLENFTAKNMIKKINSLIDLKRMQNLSLLYMTNRMFKF